jgi:hypothetical protein
VARNYISQGATLSPEGWYRYNLWRWWGKGTGLVCWVMLNPSTADSFVDDPTIRRCIGFSRAWGYGGLVVVNLFALRSTDPKALLKHADPIGLRNHEAIIDAIKGADLVVAAWGSFKVKRSRPSIDSYCYMLEKPLRCLGTTKDGSPRHPLYVAASTELVPFGLYHRDEAELGPRPRMGPPR